MLSYAAILLVAFFAAASGQGQAPPSPPPPTRVTGTVIVLHSHGETWNDTSDETDVSYAALFGEGENEKRVRFNLGAVSDAADVVTGDKITFTVRQQAAGQRHRQLLSDPLECDPSSGLCLDAGQATLESAVTAKDFVVDGKPVNITGIILHASVCDTPAKMSLDALRGALFNADQSSPSKNVTLQHYYGTCSYGKVQFLPQNNLVASVSLPCSALYLTTSTGQSVFYNSSACADPELYGWQRDALAQATQKLGVADASPFKRRVLILPYRPACAWAGLAMVGCGVTCATWLNQGSSTLFMPDLFHELGHNIGLQHSYRFSDTGQPIDYGDWTDPMGSGAAANDPFQNKSMVCLSAPVAFKAGWARPAFNLSLAGRVGIVPASPLIVTLPSMHLTDANFLYINVSSLPDFIPSWPGGVPGIPRSNQLFVSYRVKQPAPGFDSGLADELSQKVYVHSYNTTYTLPVRPDINRPELLSTLVAVLSAKATSAKAGGMSVLTQYRLDFGNLPGAPGSVNGLDLQPLVLNSTHAVLRVCYFTVASEDLAEDGCGNAPTPSQPSTSCSKAAQSAASAQPAPSAADAAKPPTAAKPQAPPAAAKAPAAAKP
ncbi:hypothetical protein GPECTOR_10g909 [Gonium pectorale]|uniref:Peptidase M11 gametolysin domain-containing protein n=1 Tax=Gonium pectorale TaxID=33097 RepID=A0A150GR47_GONPE|nr:hypothetical protein GPECTOR_10g909 [Gonium pectorale]|eukprot:KXZ52277.1 hypothetical protein GPECTOR_10g909 [Gonium pectorale]